jgi:hypothetical protein
LHENGPNPPLRARKTNLPHESHLRHFSTRHYPIREMNRRVPAVPSSVEIIATTLPACPAKGILSHWPVTERSKLCVCSTCRFACEVTRSNFDSPSARERIWPGSNCPRLPPSMGISCWLSRKFL